jgi:hypothetical protein
MANFYALAVLGAGKTGLAGTLGYRLLNADGSVAGAFTTTNVAETSVAGNYVVTGGIALPANFSGRIEWGTSGTKYAEEEINPPDKSGYSLSQAFPANFASLAIDNFGEVSAAFGAAALDLVTVESGINGRQALSLILSFCAGSMTQPTANQVIITAAGNPAIQRIVANIDPSYNRNVTSFNPPP